MMPMLDNAPTIADALTEAAGRLADAGIENSRAEARLLLCHALELGAEAVIGSPEREIGRNERSRLENVVARRAGREPMSHVLGRREFWSLEFRVTSDTLDPRPDSETLIEAVLARVADRQAPLRALDLGTGSGCLVLSLLNELTNAEGIGVDISPAAIEVARGNAVALGLDGRASFAPGDWDTGLEGVFDLVVSNPPYISSGDIDGLQPEVAQFEPRLALDGGVDGLHAYRSLGPVLARRLAGHGIAALEIGHGQSEPVTHIMSDAGLDIVASHTDLGGIPRCILLRSARD